MGLSASEGFVGPVAGRPWLSVLSKADPALLGRLAGALQLPEVDLLRAAETGMVMVRGRTGGAGQAFNLGEMTVTRCVVRLATGETGLSYVAGRDKGHAQLAATLDAMLQSTAYRAAVQTHVIGPLEQAAAARKDQTSRKARATKVDFFTMVRDRKA